MVALGCDGLARKHLSHSFGEVSEKLGSQRVSAIGILAFWLFCQNALPIAHVGRLCIQSNHLLFCHHRDLGELARSLCACSVPEGTTVRRNDVACLLLIEVQ